MRNYDFSIIPNISSSEIGEGLLWFFLLGIFFLWLLQERKLAAKKTSRNKDKGLKPKKK